MRLACGMVCCFSRLRRSHTCTCLVQYSTYGKHFLAPTGVQRDEKSRGEDRLGGVRAEGRTKAAAAAAGRGQREQGQGLQTEADQSVGVVCQQAAEGGDGNGAPGGQDSYERR